MASVTLTHGTTAYELAGPASRPLVVLLHGASIPMWIWDRQVPALLAAGYRTLRYDMYGKGNSACPSVTYDRNLFRRQLLELLVALQIDEPFHLAGFSFGGATATNFAVHHPDKVKSLALIAPVLKFAEGNEMVRIARIPVVGEMFMRFVVMKKAAGRASRIWAHAGSPARYGYLFNDQIKRAGFARAFLSFLRSDALDDYTETYRQFGTAACRALLTWGTSDEDIPASHLAQVRALVPRAEYHELPGVSHGTVFEAAGAVNEMLLRHFVGAAS